MRSVSFSNDILPLKNVLYRLALRITLSREEAEDVVQDTLIKIWNKRDSWHEIDSIENYSLTICRNLSLDKVKRADKNNVPLDDVIIARHEDKVANPAEQAIHKDRVLLVRKLIDNLPEKQRSCMQLRDFEGKSYKEIAEILRISEEQVKVNIFRARQTLKQRFENAEQYGL